MTDEELTALAESMVGDGEESLVPLYLPAAKAAVMRRLWPFEDGHAWEEVPPEFHYNACEICSYLIAKRGGEGETRHVENDTTHEWESASIPNSMFHGIVPYVGVPR